MSKLETNQVDPSTGTTLTLGTSGDTIAIPSGVTIANSGTATGFGGTNTPAFQAYMNSTQTVSSETATKINIDTEEWDTNSNFDTSNKRFLPTTAGKYFIYGGYRFDTGNADQVKYAEVHIYKNGSIYRDGVQMGNYNEQTFRNMLLTVSTTVDMNGSSDYVELYATRQTASGTDVNGGSRYTYFGGYKIIE